MKNSPKKLKIDTFSRAYAPGMPSGIRANRLIAQPCDCASIFLENAEILKEMVKRYNAYDKLKADLKSKEGQIAELVAELDSDYEIVKP